MLQHLTENAVCFNDQAVSRHLCDLKMKIQIGFSKPRSILLFITVNIAAMNPDQFVDIIQRSAAGSKPGALHINDLSEFKNLLQRLLSHIHHGDQRVHVASNIDLLNKRSLAKPSLY